MNKKTTPKMPGLLKPKLETPAVINKMLESTNTKPISLMGGGMENISGSIRDKIKNNENITQLFPDVELSIQILVSSILSPNDMLTTNIVYENKLLDMPSDVNLRLLTVIDKYLTKEYNLDNKLTTMLREALFTKGAYIEAIIPENKINSLAASVEGELTVESFTERMLDDTDDNNIKFLGDSVIPTLSLEEFNTGGEDDITTNDVISDLSLEDLNIDITDNIKTLFTVSSYNKLVSKLIKDNMKTNLSTEDASSFVRKNKTKATGNTEDVINIGGIVGTDSIDKPLIMKLATEAVIPVHVTSDPSNHLGYFIILDNNGTPITGESAVSFNNKNDIANLHSSDIKSNIINKAKQALTGITKKDPNLTNMEVIYSRLVENTIRDKLKNGLYGDIADISDNTDLYRIMFARTLKNKKTKLLYVPKEYMTYVAFDYRDNGTGKSMLEKVSMLFSIRAILLFSTLMGNLKNNVTTTEISATLDDDDPDPVKTSEKIISEVMRTRQTQLPIGVTKIDDLVDWAHKVGFKFNFKHPGLPDMEINVNESTSSKTVPDTDLDEKIQEYIIMSFGLSKELVMSGYDPEFATSIIANNILLAKRVINYQDTFSAFLTSHVRKILTLDGVVYEELKDIIRSNISPIRKMIKKNKNNTLPDTTGDEDVVNYVTNHYIDTITTKLPKPELSETTGMKEGLDGYIDVIDTFLEIIISEDAMPEELVGDMSGKLDDIKVAMKTILVKKWMSDNKYVPEMSDFLTLDNNGKPVFNLLEEYEEYIDTLSKVLLPFLKSNKKFITKTDDTLEKIEEGATDDTADTNDSSTSDTTDSDNIDGDNGVGEGQEEVDVTSDELPKEEE